MSFVLAIDQGTTSSRAIVFRSDISIAATAQQEFPQHFPASGWVEHEPEDIWTSTVDDLPRRAGAGRARRPRTSPRSASPTSARPRWCGTAPPGKPVHRAIVWQDRRTADICARLKAEGHEPAITAKTGLIIDPYFSGTKVAWILDPRARRARARRARRTAVRHRRLLPAVAADRRQGARDRRHQRLAHAAVQHPHGRVGRRAAEDPARAALDAARGEGFLRTSSATACPTCSAARSRSPASPATSRPRPSARPASRPA